MKTYYRPWHVLATMHFVLGTGKTYYPSVLESFHVDISNLRERELILSSEFRLQSLMLWKSQGRTLREQVILICSQGTALNAHYRPAPFLHVNIPRTQSRNSVTHSEQLFPFQLMQSR